MKKLNLSLIVLIITSALFVSCKKDNNEVVSSTNLATGKCKVVATVGGESYSSSDLVSLVAKSSGILNIASGTASLPIQQFVFILPAEIPVGTYNFATSDDAVDGIMTAAYSKTALSGSSVAFAAANDRDNEFTIVVTKSTATEIEATFSGTLYNETTSTNTSVTNGKLAAKF